MEQFHGSICSTPRYTSQYKLANLRKASDVVNCTVESLCHQNNIVRPSSSTTHQHWHHHWAVEAVTCADSVPQCTHLSSLPLATLNHLQLRWLTLDRGTHAQGHTHLHSQTSLINRACVQTKMCTCKHKHTRTQVCISSHHVTTHTDKRWGKK